MGRIRHCKKAGESCDDKRTFQCRAANIRVHCNATRRVRSDNHKILIRRVRCSTSLTTRKSASTQKRKKLDNGQNRRRVQACRGMKDSFFGSPVSTLHA
mgnify:CR=1 FL=1